MIERAHAQDKDNGAEDGEVLGEAHPVDVGLEQLVPLGERERQAAELRDVELVDQDAERLG